MHNTPYKAATNAAPLFKTPDYALPNAAGHFGPYGGSFVAETLTHALAELSEAYAKYAQDAEFLEEYRYELAHFVGRPSPVYHARRWSELAGGAGEVVVGGVEQGRGCADFRQGFHGGVRSGLLCRAGRLRPALPR